VYLDGQSQMQPKRMTISLASSAPIDLYPYLEIGAAQSKMGDPIILHKQLPIHFGHFRNAKCELDFLIVCSDLQGLVQHNGEDKLLGTELPEYLQLLIELELADHKKPKIGVLLCGDLYSNLKKRGASGDVRAVWMSFKEQFDWVVGVAGNHDRFGTAREKEEFEGVENIHLLHKKMLEIDGLQIAGISGIIGRADKINRVAEMEYLETLRFLLRKEPDFLLLHETPNHPEKGCAGNEKIREVIEEGPASKIFCGHCHWDTPLVRLKNDSQVLNVDARVVILKRQT
ncbi:MAG: metallophosphoesterase, partial [Bacteroidota bacterium]